MRRRAFANARPISAAAAYRAAHGGSRPASAHLAGRIRPMSAVAGRARPVSAAAARPSGGGGGGGGGSSGKLPLDPAVEKVLQMLAAQMAGTRGRSLGEVRDARDSMMQSVWSMPQGGSVEFVQEGSVQLEVVSAPGACAVSEAALVLVHGGMFMAGSPRAVRHLAGARAPATPISPLHFHHHPQRSPPLYPSPQATSRRCSASPSSRRASSSRPRRRTPPSSTTSPTPSPSSAPASTTPAWAASARRSAWRCSPSRRAPRSRSRSCSVLRSSASRRRSAHSRSRRRGSTSRAAAPRSRWGRAWR